MFKLVRILFSGFALAASVLNLAGCGQTGPLYLPAKPPALAAAQDTHDSAFDGTRLPTL